MTTEPKTVLLDAAQRVIRKQGYAAATIDDICREAGVTKGSFFHHFKSKDELALATVAYWSDLTQALFATSPYHGASDPRERLLGYVDFRASIVDGEVAEYTCLFGTLVQETYATHPDIRMACERALSTHVDGLTADIEAAKSRYAPTARWTAQSVGNFMQAVLQGSFVFAKATQSADVAFESLAHLRQYLEALFPLSPPSKGVVAL